MAKPTPQARKLLSSLSTLMVGNASVKSSKNEEYFCNKRLVDFSREILFHDWNWNGSPQAFFSTSILYPLLWVNFQFVNSAGAWRKWVAYSLTVLPAWFRYIFPHFGFRIKIGSIFILRAFSPLFPPSFLFPLPHLSQLNSRVKEDLTRSWKYFYLHLVLLTNPNCQFQTLLLLISLTRKVKV